MYSMVERLHRGHITTTTVLTYRTEPIRQGLYRCDAERHARGRQFYAHHTLHIAHCTQHTAHRTLHTAHCTSHTVHRTLHTAHCTPRTAHRTLHTAHCTPHTAHRTLLTAHCTQLTAHRTLHTCLLYTSPSPRDRTRSRMPSSA